MNSFDMIRNGFKNLWRRKFRTTITILGVVVGTAAIIIMMSIGYGLEDSYTKSIERMGSLNLITVYPQYDDGGSSGMMVYSSSGRPAAKAKLDDNSINDFSKIKGVEMATPIMRYYGSAILMSGKYRAYISFMGMRPDAMQFLGYQVDQGRLLSEEDSDAFVFGGYIPQYFYNPRSRNYYGNPDGTPLVDVMNDRIQLTFDYNYASGNMQSTQGGKKPKVYNVNVVGLLTQTYNEQDWSVIVGIDQLKKMIKEYQSTLSPEQKKYETNYDEQGYDMAYVRVKDVKDVDTVRNQIEAMGYRPQSLTDILKEMMQQTELLRQVLLGIGVVAFFISALSITNTMVMSVYERTREIGVMKVLGCKLSDIFKMFLFEAFIIGILGGITGVGVSYIASNIMNNLAGGGGLFGQNYFYYGAGETVTKLSLIPPGLALMALCFAMLIGVLTGIYPSSRAMRISALEAIKTE